MAELISTVDEVTPAWLSRAFADGGRLTTGTVTDVTSARIGSGRLGTTYLLTPTYSAAGADGPERLVAKLAATDESSLRFSAAMGAYAREVAFYRDVAAHVPVRTPECYHASVSEDGRTFCLLLEDLTPAAECGQLQGCDVDRARTALRQAAALHAGSWKDQSLRRFAWLSSGLAVWRHLGTEAGQAQKAFRAGYEGLLDDASHRVAAGLETGVARRFVERIAQPRCLWHSDFRLDNLLFDARGGRVPLVVVDWQSVALADGTIDASYFVGASVPTDLRREHEEELVRGYHQALVDGGVRDYGWDECWRDYRINALAGFLVAMTAALGTERSPDADAMFTTMAARHAAHIEDHDTLSLLEA
jgi:hypothetical protein